MDRNAERSGTSLDQRDLYISQLQKENGQLRAANKAYEWLCAGVVTALLTIVIFGKWFT